MKYVEVEKLKEAMQKAWETYSESPIGATKELSIKLMHEIIDTLAVERESAEPTSKKCACSKCGREFDMPIAFSGTILCENCDYMMNDKPVQTDAIEWEKWNKWKESHSSYLAEIKDLDLMDAFIIANNIIVKAREQFEALKARII